MVTVRGWTIGVAVSVAAHAGLFLLARATPVAPTPRAASEVTIRYVTASELPIRIVDAEAPPRIEDREEAPTPNPGDTFEARRSLAREDAASDAATVDPASPSPLAEAELAEALAEADRSELAEAALADAARVEAERAAVGEARIESERAAVAEARVEAERAAVAEARIEAERAAAADAARVEAERAAVGEARIESERAAAAEANRSDDPPATDPTGAVEIEAGSPPSRARATAEEASVLADPTGGGSSREGPELTVRGGAPTVHDAPLVLPRRAPRSGTPLAPTAGGGLVSKHRTFTANIAPDGTVEFEDHLAGYTGLGFWFDVTDTVTKLAGDDAYYAAKMRVLDDTRELRLAMAQEACEERLDETLFALKADLEALWTDPALTEREKKRMIFQLWDDCAEEGSASMVSHGKMARVTIVEFVEKRLPAGSALAYTASELVALNDKRVSKARFDPYAQDDP